MRILTNPVRISQGVVLRCSMHIMLYDITSRCRSDPGDGSGHTEKQQYFLEPASVESGWLRVEGLVKSQPISETPHFRNEDKPQLSRHIDRSQALSPS